LRDRFVDGRGWTGVMGEGIGEGKVEAKGSDDVKNG
jgi:hypothetical protein